MRSSQAVVIRRFEVHIEVRSVHTHFT